MQPEESNKIEDVKQSLYSRNAPDIRTRRKMRFFGKKAEVPTSWDRPGEPQAEPVPSVEYKDHSMSFFVKVLIGSFVFCALAVGVGAYLFLNGSNLISANNISIDISGPVSVPAGTPISLTIKIANKNNVILKDANLLIQFPAGTTKPEDTTTSLESIHESLGDIAPGASITKTAQAVVFGEQNLQKQISVVVTYGVAGSSSIFTKEQTYEILINSSPVVVSASSFKEVTSGQEFETAVTIKSNAENTLKNVLLKATYPFGFEYKSSSLRPLSSDNTTWLLGDIPPGATRTIVINGALTGENSDLRSFRFAVGSQRSGAPSMIGTLLTESQNEVSIQKPFISLAIVLNNDATNADYVGQFGRSQNVTIRWTNNMPETISNTVITAKLSGSAYDKDGVLASGGFYRSATDEVVWNQQTNSELRSIKAGDTGTVTFSVVPANKGSGGMAISNPILTIAANVSADRTSASNVPNETTYITRNIKIASSVALSGRVARNQGPFANTGPIPPVAEQKSTYTVFWSVANSSNSVTNAIVAATLPPYVAWVGMVSPQTEEVTYDQNSGTVTWNVGSLSTSVSGSDNRREVAFQIALTPSVDQVNNTPILMNKAVLTALDGWTGSPVSSTQNYLSTSFSTDPTFKGGDDSVRPK